MSDLLKAAQDVCVNAYAPYSKFNVGAALRDENGYVHVGCNVENIAYPEGTCAEAGAIAAMVASGGRKLSEITIVASSPLPIAPCGGCRQKIAEFADADVVVTMVSQSGKVSKMTVGDLLPGAFGAAHMDL